VSETGIGIILLTERRMLHILGWRLT